MPKGRISMHYPPMLPGRRRRPGDEADQEKRLQGLSRGYEDSPWLTALVDFSGFLVVLVGSFTAWWDACLPASGTVWAAARQATGHWGSQTRDEIGG